MTRSIEEKNLLVANCNASSQLLMHLIFVSLLFSHRLLISLILESSFYFTLYISSATFQWVRLGKE